MEKIKIQEQEFEILGIRSKPKLLEIQFTSSIDLSEIDLTLIELYTAGGVKCADFKDYTTIYKQLDVNNVIILSNDGSVYVEPIIPDPTPVEPYEPTPEELALQLETAKKNKIGQSKILLDKYLSENPLLFTDGKYYSVTKEKQNLLSNAIAVYQMKVQIGEENPEIKWNATGEECTARPIEEVTALALAIAAYVEPLVAHQQVLEVQINLCTTIEEVNSMVIDYETVI